MPGKRLEEHVWDTVRQSIECPEDLFKVFQIQSLNADDYDRLVRERDFHQKEIKKHDAQENTVQLDYYDGKIDEERRDTLVQTYIDKRNAHIKSIMKLDEEINKIIKTQATKHALDSFAKDMQTKLDEITDAQKQFLIDLAVDRVEVTWTKSHPVVNVVLRFKPTRKDEDELEVEPEKSSNKPKSRIIEAIKSRVWCQWVESNRRPQGYESCALPLSYIGTGVSLINFIGFTSLIREICYYFCFPLVSTIQI